MFLFSQSKFILHLLLKQPEYLDAFNTETSARWSQLGDVLLSVPQAVEGGPAEAFITDLDTKTAFRSCNVMQAQDPDSCLDPKHNLFRV